MNKVALITGASSGIGKSTAKKLLKADYIVYGVSRRIEKMADIKDLGANILSMDITDDASILNAVNAIINEQGRIDVLINNAGFGSYGAVEDVSVSEARYQFEVNLFGLARLTQLILPHMRKNKYGKIVNISSMGGKIYAPLGAWYHATKHALEGWSDCLRFEVKPFGIDVIIIEPGLIKTDWQNIAIKKLLESSGNTAYSELANKTASIMKKTYAAPNVSEPELIADTILKAVTSKNPKTRYAKGYLAKPYIFFRKILPDKIYEAIVRMSLK
ncbi:MAG: oxidoreductase [Candidatus Omnitrophota bacterium]